MRKPTFVKVPSGMSDKDTMKAVATSIAAGLIEPLTEIVTKTELDETSLMVTKFRTFKVGKDDEDGTEMRAMECKTTILGGPNSSEIISMVELHCESIPEAEIKPEKVEELIEDSSEYDKMMRNLDKELVN